MSSTLAPQELGSMLATEFASGADFVVLRELPFHTMGEQARDAYIRAVAAPIGELTLTDGKPGSELWLLDSSTSPNAVEVPFHTDNPYLEQPEPIVGFWNLKSSAKGGENYILPVADLIEWAGGDPKYDDLMALLTTTEVQFRHDGAEASGVILDEWRGTARFDQKYIVRGDPPLGRHFAAMLKDTTIPMNKVKLAPGDALFFANDTTLHARAPYSDPRRQSIRVRIRPHHA